MSIDDLIHLQEVEDEQIERWCGEIDRHRDTTHSNIQSLGYVVPTSTFFKQESARYRNIFPHAVRGEELVIAREVLQNSADAGTTRLDVKSKHFPRAHTWLQMGDDVRPYFVLWSDDGKWDTTETQTTFDICTQFFLKMNGSSKQLDKHDGGFGVGRFVILFGSPFWMMTTANLFIMGTYNCFQIRCRRCESPLQQSVCEKCELSENDTPHGTSMLVHYMCANGAYRLDRLLARMEMDYFRYCHVNFPIFINGKEIERVKPEKTIAKEKDMTVYKYELFDDTNAVYLVRTARGVLMFSTLLWSQNCEKGIYAVDLGTHVKYTDFDQSRQNVMGEVGKKLRSFFDQQSINHRSHDVEKEIEMMVHGKCPKASLKLTTESSIPLEIRNVPRLEWRKNVLTHDHGTKGPLKCVYFFRDGYTLDKVPEKWKSGRDYVYLLLNWTMCLSHVLKCTSFSKAYQHALHRTFEVGLVFDKSTEACKRDYVFFINPLLLEKKVGAISSKGSSMRQNRSKFQSYLMAMALHEITHLYVHGHDSSFASIMTDLTYATLHYNINYRHQHRTTRRLSKTLLGKRVATEPVGRPEDEPVPENKPKKSKRQKSK